MALERVNDVHLITMQMLVIITPRNPGYFSRMSSIHHLNYHILAPRSFITIAISVSSRFPLNTFSPLSIHYQTALSGGFILGLRLHKLLTEHALLMIQYTN